MADFYGDLIQDNLLSINPAEFPGNPTFSGVIFAPATGNVIFVENLVVPEDTIIVFVGSRVFSGNTAGRGGVGGASFSNTPGWEKRVLGRGQPGAEFSSDQANRRTDMGLWGGQIAFDDDTDWNFSLEENQDGVEFLNVALHEMAHVLGIGAADPWRNLIEDRTFTGPNVIASFGSAPAADAGHFLTTTRSPLYGAFGAPHGLPRRALMFPVGSDNGSNFDVVTDLDLSALVDIGWEVTIPAPLCSHLKASHQPKPASVGPLLPFVHTKLREASIY